MNRGEIKTRHITTDGKDYISPEAAIVHQRRVDFEKELDTIIGASPSLKIGHNIICNAAAILECLEQFADECLEFEGVDIKKQKDTGLDK